MIPFPKVKVPMHKNERASLAPEAGSGRYSLRMATNPVDGSSNILSAFLDSIVSNRSIMAPLPEQAQVYTW
jgi:hypothetical protein